MQRTFWTIPFTLQFTSDSALSCQMPASPPAGAGAEPRTERDFTIATGLGKPSEAFESEGTIMAPGLRAMGESHHVLQHPRAVPPGTPGRSQMRLRVRARLSSLLGRMGASQTWLAARRLGQPRWLTVLNYHRVDELGAAGDVDEGVLDATPASLDRQLGRLRRHCTPIALGDLLAHLDGADLPANPALVTFDDGYRDNLTIATPILDRHGIRATFFIATAYVAERRLFWWDRISWTLKHARRRRFRVDYPASLEVNLEAGVGRPAQLLHRVVKTTRLLDLERFLDDLAIQADAPWNGATEHRLADRLIMTWDDVRALRRAGMDVGSHTRTHRVLQTLAQAELPAELTGSRSDLESELGEPVSTIAYPVGPSIAGEPEIRAAAVAAGYRLGFTYGTSLQPLRIIDPLDIHRLGVEHTIDDARFCTLLAAPWLES